MKSKTRKGLWAIATLLVILVILASGCAGHPKGWKNPREMTDSEKDRIVKIALNTPEALRQLETKNQYKTEEVDWFAIVWDNSQWSAYWRIRSEWETDPNYELVSEAAVFYPAVTIRFGEPEEWQVTVAVDLDTEKVALVQEYPARKGPSQPNPSLLEIRLAPIHEVLFNIAESYPPQVILYIKGGLSGGCANVLTNDEQSPGGAVPMNTALVQVELTPPQRENRMKEGLRRSSTRSRWAATWR